MKLICPLFLVLLLQHYSLIANGARSCETCLEDGIVLLIASMGSFDTSTSRMDPRRCRQHGLLADDPSAGFYDTSVHGA